MQISDIQNKIRNNPDPYFLACTRFNKYTWNENQEARKIHSIKALYGCDIEIAEKIPIKSNIFVLEMNNETHQIMGVGLIRKRIIFKPLIRIYANNNYNRYIYAGKQWICRERLIEKDEVIFNQLEQVLFTGRSHMKRLTGISIISNKLCRHIHTTEQQIIDNYIYPLFDKL